MSKYKVVFQAEITVYVEASYEEEAENLAFEQINTGDIDVNDTFAYKLEE